MVARAVGIQLSETFVRAAVVEQKGRVIGYYEAEIPEDAEKPWTERATATLQDVFTRGKIPKSNIVAGLDSGELLIRIISVPFKDEAQIRKTIKFELETHITQYAAEDLIVDFTIVGETETGATLLAAAAPKELLEQRLKALGDCGADPCVVDLELFAVVRALRAAGGLNTEKPVLIVHGTPKHAKFVLYEDGLVRNIRTIRFSLPETNAPKPEEKKKKYDTRAVGGPVPLIVMTEGARDVEKLPPGSREALIKLLSKEIQRFLLGAGGAAPEQVFLTGEFEGPGIARMLQKAAKLPVSLIDVFKTFEHPFNAAQQVEVRRRILEPLGLALRGLPDGEEGLDFSQEEFVYARRLERVAGAGLIFLELVLMLIAAFCLNHFFRMRDAKEASDQLLALKTNYCEAVTKEPVPEGQDPYKRLVAWASGQGGGADYPLRRSALDEVAKAYGVIERFGAMNIGRKGTEPFYLRLTRVSADFRPEQTRGTLVLGGIISLEEDLDRLRQDLERAGFNDPLMQKVYKDGRFEFTATIPVEYK